MNRSFIQLPVLALSAMMAANAQAQVPAKPVPHGRVSPRKGREDRVLMGSHPSGEASFSREQRAPHDLASFFIGSLTVVKP